MMKLSTSTLSALPAAARHATPQLRPLLLQRSYATQHSLGTTSSPGPRRKKVTPFNDDGHVPWSELSAGEKAARATQQSFNFGFILLGLVMTGGVSYFLYTEVFSPDSKVSHFNRSVDRIKKDQACIDLLGDPKKISAHGEETWNKWRRARPIASTIRTDPQGKDHLMMHFYVEGPKNKGTVNVHMIRPDPNEDFEYKYFYIDVRGHPRLYLENADTATSSSEKKKLKLFGVSWG